MKHLAALEKNFGDHGGIDAPLRLVHCFWNVGHKVGGVFDNAMLKYPRICQEVEREARIQVRRENEKD